MNTVLRNLTFDDVQNLKLFSALKREANFRGWLSPTDDRYIQLQGLCNDIRESTVNPQMPITLLRNDNEGPDNAMGDTDLMFVASAEAWQTIREWLYDVGLNCDWW